MIVVRLIVIVARLTVIMNFDCFFALQLGRVGSEQIFSMGKSAIAESPKIFYYERRKSPKDLKWVNTIFIEAHFSPNLEVQKNCLGFVKDSTHVANMKMTPKLGNMLKQQ